MKYVLDTNVISDIVRGHALVLARVKGMHPDLLAISVVTLMELEYGVYLNPDRTRKIAPVLDEILHDLAILEFRQEDARVAAVIRADLKKRGKAYRFIRRADRRNRT